MEDMKSRTSLLVCVHPQQCKKFSIPGPAHKSQQCSLLNSVFCIQITSCTSSNTIQAGEGGWHHPQLKIPTRLHDLAPAYLQPQDHCMGSFLCLDCSTPRPPMFGSFSTFKSYLKCHLLRNIMPRSPLLSNTHTHSLSHYVYLPRYTIFFFVYLFIVCLPSLECKFHENSLFCLLLYP